MTIRIIENILSDILSDFFSNALKKLIYELGREKKDISVLLNDFSECIDEHIISYGKKTKRNYSGGYLKIVSENEIISIEVELYFSDNKGKWYKQYSKNDITFLLSSESRQEIQNNSTREYEIKKPE
jgi:hypothetical protein